MAEPVKPLREDQLAGLELLADNLEHSAYGADRNKAPHMKLAVAQIRSLQAEVEQLRLRDQELSQERDGLRVICVDMIARPPSTAGLTKLEDIALALDEADSMMDWGGSEMQDDLRRWSEALNRVINGA